MIRNIVLGSGSVKGIVYIGCLQFLEEYELLKNVTTIVGTSVGGIFALLINLGYTSSQIKTIILSIDFTQLSNINSDSVLNIMENYGIDSGEKLINALSVLIKKKQTIFKLLFRNYSN